MLFRSSSGVFQGQATINDVPASEGDWIAAFDEDGNIAGAQALIIYEGDAYINLSIYGDDSTTPDVDEGINAGENFFLKVWDASEYVIVNFPTGFSDWYNNNGAPMEGYNDPSVMYNFVYVETNEPPVANAGAGQEVMAGDTVSLHGSGSYDPNGDDITYMWAAPDGIVLDNDTAVEPTFIAPAVDESTAYEFTLVVNDGEYDSGSDNVVVTVTPVNNPPIVEDISVETNEDTPVGITLIGFDPESEDRKSVV